jgi:hypothetical protein
MMGVHAMTGGVEILIDGSLYRCYRTRHSPDDVAESYVVAGVGSVTIERDTGAVVAVTPVMNGGARLLEKLAQLIHDRAPSSR